MIVGEYSEFRHWLIKPDRPTYYELIQADWPDFAAIKEFEETVAAGIVRFVEREQAAGNTEPFLLMTKVLHDDCEPLPAWGMVWNRIHAYAWINVYDCDGASDDLWLAAMNRAYYKLFEGTYEYPSERNGVQ
jgi:hypothetical protein